MIVAMGDGQRKRGRPRTRWLDGIEENTSMPLQQLTEVTRNCTRWREKVMTVTRGRYDLTAQGELSIHQL